MGIVVDAEGNVSFGVGHGLRTRAWMGQVALGAIEATADMWPQEHRRAPFPLVAFLLWAVRVRRGRAT